MATGDSGNTLTADAVDPVSRIPEYKAFLCDVVRAKPTDG
jgi:hypothetical protein